MEPNRNNLDLAGILRALRPTPQPEFAAHLDARAAAGFPRDSRSWKSRLAGSIDRMRTAPPRRFLVPAGGVAVAAIVVASAVIVTSETDLGPQEQRFSATPGTGVQYSAAPPPRRLVEPAAAGKASASDTGASAIEFHSTSTDALSRAIDSGPYASQAGHRDIERSAQMVLGADPSDVRAGAAKVFGAVHTADGIVLSSSIRDGGEGEAGADFDLLIPSARLGDALAAFSAIGEVRSRHESTQDITAPTVSVEEKLRDSRAKIEGLLAQLAAADTEAERVAAETELRAERRHAATLRSRLSQLRRRAHFSRVSLRIETGAPAAASEGSGAAWGIGDGLDDAGRILAVAAGVTVIALAILGPLALIALLAWLAHRTLVRRSRERVLD